MGRAEGGRAEGDAQRGAQRGGHAVPSACPLRALFLRAPFLLANGSPTNDGDRTRTPVAVGSPLLEHPTPSSPPCTSQFTAWGGGEHNWGAHALRANERGGGRMCTGGGACTGERGTHVNGRGARDRAEGAQTGGGTRLPTPALRPQLPRTDLQARPQAHRPACTRTPPHRAQVPLLPPSRMTLRTSTHRHNPARIPHLHARTTPQGTCTPCHLPSVNLEKKSIVYVNCISQIKLFFILV